MDLEDLYEQIRNEPRFAHLRAGKNRLVPGEGSVNESRVMILGEAPGAQEAMKLRPFVGESGRALRHLMHMAHLCAFNMYCEHPENAWLTNVIKYRPPRNRAPLPDEIETARYYLRREWDLIGRPSVVIAVGVTALMTLTPSKKAIWPHASIYYKQGDVTIWPMVHPAYGLRHEAARPAMEGHWRELARWLASTPNAW